MAYLKTGVLFLSILCITSMVKCQTGVTSETSTAVITGTEGTTQDGSSAGTQQTSDPGSSSTESTTFSTTPLPSEQPRGEELVNGALVPMYRMTNFFADTMVHYGRNIGLLADWGYDFSSVKGLEDSFIKNWQTAANYWVGYATCLAVGIVALIVLIIIALVVPCCRCCGNCGGKIDERESENSTCIRVGCGFTLFCVTSIILAGGILLLFSSFPIKKKLDGDLFDEFVGSFQAVEDFKEYTYKDMEIKTLGEFKKTSDEIFDRMLNLSDVAILQLDSETNITANMNSMKDFIDSFEMARNQLSHANSMVKNLTQRAEKLDIELVSIQERVNDTLSNCTSTACTDLTDQIENVKVNIEYSMINFDYSIEALDEAINQNLSAKIEEGLAEFDAAAKNLSDKINPEVEKARNKTKEVENSIDKYLKDVKSKIDKLNLTGAIDWFENAKEPVKKNAPYVFWSMVGVAASIFIIVLCNYVGLMCGAFCKLPQLNDPTCGTTKVAANWLLAGVGFTFIFIWIYLILVIPLFAGLGILHSDVCRQVANYDKAPTELRDALDKLTNNSLYEFIQMDLKISHVYDSCQDNEALYEAFELEKQGFNITSVVDTSVVKDAIAEISKVDLSIPDLEFLPNDVVTSLRHIDQVLGEISENITKAIGELSQDVTGVNLIQFAEQLKNASAEDSSVGDVTELVANLTALQNDYVIPMGEMGKETAGVLQNVSSLLSAVNLTETASNVKASEDFINNNGTEWIKGFVNNSLTSVQGTVETLASNISTSVKTDIGNCRPLHSSFNSVVDASCVELLWPANTFWFSLGWVCFFLIISIIASFKLVTQYRKTIGYLGDDDDSPLYHAFSDYNGYSGTSPGDVQLQKLDQDEDGMGYQVNPVYVPDEGALKIPRPHLSLHSQTPPGGNRPGGAYTGAFENPGYGTGGYRLEGQDGPQNISPPPGYADIDSRDQKL